MGKFQQGRCISFHWAMTMGRVCGYVPHKKRGKGFKMFQSWDTSQVSIVDGQPTPPQTYSPWEIRVYIRPYSGKPMVRDHYTTHFMGNQTVQMYGSFEGFPPLNSALLGLVIQWPLMVPPLKTNMTLLECPPFESMYFLWKNMAIFQPVMLC